MRLSTTTLLLLTSLLLTSPPIVAQSGDTTDTRYYSERGWVFGVGFYGSYAPVVSSDLDRVFTEQGGFEEYGFRPLSFSSRIILGWPNVQYGFSFESGAPTREEIAVENDAVRRVQSQKMSMEISAGLPLRFGDSPLGLVPTLGLGSHTLEVDMTETTGENSLLVQENTSVLFAQDGSSIYLHPQLVIDLQTSRFLSLQAIGGVTVPFAHIWKTSTGEEVSEGPALDLSPSLRIGIMINMVDALFRPEKE